MRGRFAANDHRRAHPRRSGTRSGQNEVGLATIFRSCAANFVPPSSDTSRIWSPPVIKTPVTPSSKLLDVRLNDVLPRGRPQNTRICDAKISETPACKHPPRTPESPTPPARSEPRPFRRPQAQEISQYPAFVVFILCPADHEQMPANDLAVVRFIHVKVYVLKCERGLYS